MTSSRDAYPEPVHLGDLPMRFWLGVVCMVVGAAGATFAGMFAHFGLLPALEAQVNPFFSGALLFGPAIICVAAGICGTVLLVERQRGSYVPLLAIPLYIVNFHVSSFFLAR
ncbi:hypothetical protein [Leucobacter japonicus]|uniref:hypothetical protein n=1 Tax=Leucobacter japonicus TaxID=1461259 RepID=UPI0006A7920F|nr:hypothetical protein [Leucobacter japonicus]